MTAEGDCTGDISAACPSTRLEDPGHMSRLVPQRRYQEPTEEAAPGGPDSCPLLLQTWLQGQKDRMQTLPRPCLETASDNGTVSLFSGPG